MAVRFTSANSTYRVNLNRPTGNLTVATWFKVSVDRNTYSTIFSVDGGGPTDGFVVAQTDNDGTTLQVFPVDSGAINIPLTIGTWYFLGVTVSGTTATVRVRAQGGATFSSGSVPLIGAVEQTRLLIGTSSFDETGEWLNGCISNFRIWSGVALSIAELEAEYQYASPLRTDGLTAFYRFDTASTVDNSGHGYTLTGGSGASTEAGPTGLIEPGGDTGPTIHGWGSVPIF